MRARPGRVLSAHIPRMGQLNDLADFRREKARRTDGRFGAQQHSEAEVSLTSPDHDETAANAEPEAQSPWVNARRVYLSMKDTNARMRKTLAAEFPGTKFSVRGDTYAGGSSTDVTWINGPKEQDVKDALTKYVASRPDYTFDYWDPVESHEFDENGDPVINNYSSDHVFTRRKYSPEVKAAATVLVTDALADEGQLRDSSKLYHVPQGLFKRATVENGGRDEHGQIVFRTGGWNGTYIQQLDSIAMEMLANESYNRELAEPRPNAKQRRKATVNG